MCCSGLQRYFLFAVKVVETECNECKVSAWSGAYCFWLDCLKSTEVQALGAFALHATTACTDDTSIVATQLGYNLVSCLVLHVVWSVHVHVRVHMLVVYACTYALPSYGYVAWSQRRGLVRAPHPHVIRRCAAPSTTSSS